MANGCTSGHGVCGLPRLSKRSFAAVGTFLVFGLGFATLRYYVKFLETDFILSKSKKDDIILSDKVVKVHSIIFFCLSIIGFILVITLNVAIKKIYEFKEILISFFVGFLFSFGLIESGMVKRHLVLSFLSIGKDWDATLLCVLGCAVGLNLITFNLILKNMEKPIFYKTFQLPDKTEIDRKLIVGAAIFGIGWGWGGICPGPIVLSFYFYIPQTIIFIVMVICGQLLENKVDKNLGNFINGIKEENKLKENENSNQKNEEVNNCVIGEQIKSNIDKIYNNHNNNADSLYREIIIYNK